MRFCLSVVCSMLALMFIVSPAPLHAQETKIEDGRTVTFEYKLTIDGQVVESSEGKEPLQYTQGSGEIIPGLENKLLGMMAGDQKTVIVPAKDAYGEINEQAYREVEKSKFPPDFSPEAGMIIEIQNPDGGATPAIVWEVKAETVVLNFNHPLAGKTLQFDVKIVSVK